MEVKYTIAESDTMKILNSEDYNYTFNKVNGNFARWGKLPELDPETCPFGPEIADIEISTICSGGNNGPCTFCYKNNSPVGAYMDLETFKIVFDKLPKSLTQIAFGIGDIDANPDMWEIFRHCRKNGIIPNVTINGSWMTPDYYDQLVSLCGAVAVSRYDKDICYNAVEELTSRGMKQVNIHSLLAAESYDDCLKLIDDAREDERLKDLNAIVFLALKPKGRAVAGITPFKDIQKYSYLVHHAMTNGVRIGFDSCSAPTFLKAVENHPDYEYFMTMVDPCESMLFSIYINVKGLVYPCSFLEPNRGLREDIYETADFHDAINMLGVKDFLAEVWYHPEVKRWRQNLLDTAKREDALVPDCRQCPKYNIYPEQEEKEWAQNENKIWVCK